MAEHVGLFLPLPKRLARQYPPEGKEGEDTSPPHVTFLYIGEVEEDRIDELRGVCERVLQAVPPLEMTLKPPATFQNDQGQTIVHSPVACPILERCHRAVRRALERRGFNVEAWDEFKPHVTIEYVDPGKQAQLDYLNPTGRWYTDTMGFWAGDDRRDLPLGGRSSTVACLRSVGRPDLARVVAKGRRDLANRFAYGADSQLKAYTDEMERFGKAAIDMVSKRKPMDIGAYFHTSTATLTFYSDKWNGTNPETKRRLIDLKYEVGNALKSKTRRRVLEVKQRGKKLWTQGAGSFGAYKFVDGYVCAIQLMQTPEEREMVDLVALRGAVKNTFKSFSYKPIITPPPRRNEPEPEPEPELFAFLGKTFANKALLKQAGAKWSPNDKAWLAPKPIADKLLSALDSAGVKYRLDGYDVWLV